MVVLADDDSFAASSMGWYRPLMSDDMDPVAHNRAAWDRQVDAGNEWTQPVSPDVIARARSSLAVN